MSAEISGGGVVALQSRTDVCLTELLVVWQCYGVLAQLLLGRHQLQVRSDTIKNACLPTIKRLCAQSGSSLLLMYTKWGCGVLYQT
jgi:hypothetical protein